MRILTIIDEYTREWIGIHVAPSFSGAQVVSVLEWSFLTCGVPSYIRSDNGPEFVAKSVRDWLQKARVKTLYIPPSSPWENGHIESFNGKLRDECLNREIFRNGKEAQETVENWRKEYNECCPHSSLGYLIPNEFSAISESSIRTTSDFQIPISQQQQNIITSTGIKIKT